VDDIADRADIEDLIVAFYTTAFADPLIGPIFTDVARLDREFDRHLPVMVDFWDTVLFRTGAYRRNALQLHYVLHAKHPLEAPHFARWLALWTATVDARFAGPVAERAKLQADRIAGSIERRLAGGSGSEFVTLSRRPDPS
jgi:hemoglobin